MIRAAVIALAVALVAGAAARAAAPPNVRGVVVGGATAICPRGEPCDPPSGPAFVAFSRPGRAPVVVRIGAGGAFALHLRPGLYSITLRPPPYGGKLRPSTVWVPATGVVRLSLRVG